MSTSLASPIRVRATALELEHRLTYVAAALFNGLPASLAIRFAMDSFRVSRRMAQRYVGRIAQTDDPLVQRVHAAAKALVASRQQAVPARSEDDPTSCASL